MSKPSVFSNFRLGKISLFSGNFRLREDPPIYSQLSGQLSHCYLYPYLERFQGIAEWAEERLFIPGKHYPCACAWAYTDAGIRMGGVVAGAGKILPAIFWASKKFLA